MMLTHLSLVSFLWDIGKQYSLRCGAAECGVPSGAILFAKRIFIQNVHKNLKSLLIPLKTKVNMPKCWENQFVKNGLMLQLHSGHNFHEDLIPCHKRWLPGF